MVKAKTEEVTLTEEYKGYTGVNLDHNLIVFEDDKAKVSIEVAKVLRDKGFVQ